MVFHPHLWKYFYDLIRETYPEIGLKISYDSNHNFPRIYKRVAGDVVDGAKAYLSQRLQSLGLKFDNDSINTIVSDIGLLIFEEILMKRRFYIREDGQYLNFPLGLSSITSSFQY